MSKRAAAGRPVRGPSSRRALVLTTAVALLLAPASPAGGQSSGGATEAPGRPDFGIRPGHYGDTTLPGGHYSFSLEPGTAIDDSVEIFNFTDAPLRFDLYGADLILAEGGGFAPAARGAAPGGSGGWIVPERVTVEVAAYSSLLVPFRVNIPKGALPGDHPGTIVVEQQVDARRGMAVSVQPRLALRVLITVPGEVDLGVELGALQATREGSTVRFTLPVRNSGNVTFTTTGAVQVHGASEALPLQPDGLYAVPGGEATLRVVWADPPWIGRVRAHAELEVMLGDREPVRYTTETITVWLIPLSTLVAMALVLLLALALVRTTRNQRRDWVHRRREERELLRDFRARRIEGGSQHERSQERVTSGR